LAEFVTELKRAVKVLGRRNAGDALFSYADDHLRIRLGGAEWQLPAKGHWRGEARVGSSLLRPFAKVPPAQDPLVIQVYQGRLRIAGSSAPCHWQREGEAMVEVALGMELIDLLRLAHAHPQRALEKSGVASSIDSARRELDKRIDAASRHLAPFGVTPADVRLLVIGKLKLHDSTP
jgi:hypothetical protein